MILYPPISLKGSLPNFEDALPEPTYELIGDKGVKVAVGNTVSALVFRGTFNKKNNQGSWSLIGAERDHTDDNFYSAPPFDIDYMCKLANIKIRNFIHTYGK